VIPVMWLRPMRLNLIVGNAENRWFDGALLRRQRPLRVKPIAEMSFRNALALQTKGWD
jgi:hypothetical protein